MDKGQNPGAEWTKILLNQLKICSFLIEGYSLIMNLFMDSTTYFSGKTSNSEFKADFTNHDG